MPNKNYVKGRNKEYKICKELKEDGYEIAQRTAGSHSPIDIFAIHRVTRSIVFVQAKPDNYSEKKTQAIYDELNYLNGDDWKVKFMVI